MILIPTQTCDALTPNKVQHDNTVRIDTFRYEDNFISRHPLYKPVDVTEWLEMLIHRDVRGFDSQARQALFSATEGRAKPAFHPSEVGKWVL